MATFRPFTHLQNTLGKGNSGRKIVSVVFALLCSISTFTAGCGGGGGSSSSGGGNPPPPQNPGVTISVSADKEYIDPGQQATITWTISGADTATLSEAVLGSSDISTLSLSEGAAIAEDADDAVVVRNDGGQPATERKRALSFKTISSSPISLSGTKTVSPSKITKYTFVAVDKNGTPTSKDITIYVTDQLVLIFNVGPEFWTNPNTPGKTQRWADGFVDVYDQTGYSRLQDVLDAWNSVIGGNVILRKSSNPNSPITITLTDTAPAGHCGSSSIRIANASANDYRIIKVDLAILRSCNNNYGTYLHSMGHAIGFMKHTVEAGLMSGTVYSETITQLVYNTIHRLYSLPVGTYIPY